jgi:hypothetical protein
LVWLTGWRRAVNSSASARALLQVQRSGDSGSPRAVGSTKPSKAGAKPGSLDVNAWRPPPSRRIRPEASGAVCNSSMPLVNVTRDKPQARLTREMPL